MAEELLRPRLGRGLAALIGDVGEDLVQADRSPRGQKRVPIEFLRPNPRNPRKHFAEEELDELASSIRERGLIQPIVVRSLSGLPDAYEIIAGERRWRASQRAGLHDVPVVVLEADDRTALELAIIENVQRTDLNAIEEAAGYDRLITEHGYSQIDIATALGKSRSHVANTLRLLKLSPNIREMVMRGELTAGHARALLAVEDPEAVAQRILERGLNVREVERIAQGEDENRPALKRAPKDPDTRALENLLESALGLVVRVERKGEGGEVRLRYKDLDQLDMICRRLQMSATH